MKRLKVTQRSQLVKDGTGLHPGMRTQLPTSVNNEAGAVEGHHSAPAAGPAHPTRRCAQCPTPVCVGSGTAILGQAPGRRPWAASRKSLTASEPGRGQSRGARGRPWACLWLRQTPAPQPLQSGHTVRVLTSAVAGLPSLAPRGLYLARPAVLHVFRATGEAAASRSLAPSRTHTGETSIPGAEAA